MNDGDEAPMGTLSVTDEDIRNFLRKNWHVYPSQIMLLQEAVQRLWPADPPPESGVRVVRICLQENDFMINRGKQLLLDASSSDESP